MLSPDDWQETQADHDEERMGWRVENKRLRERIRELEAAVAEARRAKDAAEDFMRCLLAVDGFPRC